MPNNHAFQQCINTNNALSYKYMPIGRVNIGKENLFLMKKRWTIEQHKITEQRQDNTDQMIKQLSTIR